MKQIKEENRTINQVINVNFYRKSMLIKVNQDYQVMVDFG